ncbi:helix-turn-helix domain-containing protein [Alicyclobacillus fastidiosus]|uniref:helix-turn-helix domain-containing protein n=1 Tax=Alicyclobacillus fastidiosus TaxID=392011 RepID=UPI003D6760FD
MNTSLCAQKIGMSQSRLTKMETGQRPFRADLVCTLADILGVSTGYFLKIIWTICPNKSFFKLKDYG